MITDPSQLKVGMTIYLVHAFSDARKQMMCSITESEVLAVSITTTTGLDDFMRVKESATYIQINFDDSLWDYKSHASTGVPHETSMQDMGIIPNKYNKHGTFDNMSEAKRYLSTIVGLTIKEPAGHNTNNYDRAMRVLDLD